MWKVLSWPHSIQFVTIAVYYICVFYIELTVGSPLNILYTSHCKIFLATEGRMISIMIDFWSTVKGKKRSHALVMLSLLEYIICALFVLLLMMVWDILCNMICSKHEKAGVFYAITIICVQCAEHSKMITM